MDRPTQQSFRLEVVPDAAALGRRAADVVQATVEAKPDTVLAVPTGSTPLGMFGELIGRVRREDLDLRRVHLFCLDEYVGLSRDDPNSLTGWLDRELLGPAGFDRQRVHVVPAADPDSVAAAACYEAALAALGGLDLAVLGLGPNGHVAYNEPGSAADSRTRVVNLAQSSIDGAAKTWKPPASLPTRAMTIGVGTLLEARRLVLIVAGAAKADVLRRTLREPMDATVPASWLRLAGDRLLVIADEAAAGRVTNGAER